VCEPVTIGLAIFGAVSALQEGAANKQQADAQAGIAKSNAKLARQSAEDARAKGVQERRQKQIETARLIGLQRAGAAGAGVQVDSGSALDLTSDTAQFGKLDELTIKNNAEREAFGFEAKAAQFDADADNFKKAGDAAMTSGFLKAGTSLLGSANAAGITGSDLFGASSSTVAKKGITGTSQLNPLNTVSVGSRAQ